MSRMRILLPVLVLALASCQGVEPSTPADADVGLPNPASVYCEENGGTLEIRQDAGGGQYGVCVFPDGSECDEWAYFRGECAPGNAAQPQTPAEEKPAGGWQTFQDDQMGYRFEYPPDCVLEQVQRAPGSLSISGTSPDNEFWPQITLNHPSNREGFQPPLDASLEEWLANHSLLPDERLPDTIIAGEPAVHLRHERSPQSYAFDRFYFAHAGQLYEIVIGHVGDYEDWDLYNRFLERFEFID